MPSFRGYGMLAVDFGHDKSPHGRKCDDRDDTALRGGKFLELGVKILEVLPPC